MPKNDQALAFIFLCLFTFIYLVDLLCYLSSNDNISQTGAYQHAEFYGQSPLFSMIGDMYL